MHRLLTVDDNADGQRLDRFVRKAIGGVPQGLIEKLCRKGAIRIDGKRAKANVRLVLGQVVKLPESIEGKVAEKGTATALDARDFFAPLTLWQNKEFIVINKPFGWASQGGTNVRDSVDRYAAGLGWRLTHRLDKDTSGVMLIAKTERAAREATGAFKEKTFTKTYWALVEGVPEEKDGTIDAALLDEETAKKINYTERLQEVIVHRKLGKAAVTHYRVVEEVAHTAAWLELTPETGRKHQLRVHLTDIGHPIVGDKKYGEGVRLADDCGRGMHLHARQLTHPELLGEAIDVVAPLPAHMQKSWDYFGLGQE